ncbi:hypothetical protein D3C76_1581950 [compost metagenome]
MARFGGSQNTPVREGYFAVGTAANPQVVAKTPVVQVVLTLVARLCVGRGFVLLIPGGSQKPMALLENIPQRVIIRQHRRARTKQRVRLNGQLIPGEMRRVQFDGLA